MMLTNRDAQGKVYCKRSLCLRDRFLAVPPEHQGSWGRQHNEAH
jgi:hypothetical protein